MPFTYRDKALGLRRGGRSRFRLSIESRRGWIFHPFGVRSLIRYSSRKEPWS